MSTSSVPLSREQEQFVEQFVKEHKAPDKAEVARRALRLLAEEEAIADVLRAEREVKDGKVLTGDLRELIKKI
jgi:Arc/MetJ-type ribon-helix-helix transcriptional regulator